MRDDLVDVFCKEYTAHMSTLIAAQHVDVKRIRSEQATVEKEQANIVQAIKDSVPAAMVKGELETISTRTQALKDKLAAVGNERTPLFIRPWRAATAPV